jgi:hypothetical protein
MPNNKTPYSLDPGTYNQEIFSMKNKVENRKIGSKHIPYSR